MVVTGIGLVTPLGCGNVEVWERLLNGDSGVLTTPENIFPADPVSEFGDETAEIAMRTFLCISFSILRIICKQLRWRQHPS